ncbi:MAG: thiol:disulfide interchange protein, partial [Prevotellaceae bacterium]|nr:thiol:disulfide interchange protein [Prevotellaceae bacterium]
MKSTKLLLLVCLLLCTWTAVQAQIQEPVTFTAELKQVNDREAELVFTGVIEKGWHVYATELGDGGPISAALIAEQLEGATLDGTLKAIGEEKDSYDKLFDMNVRYFETAVTFVQRVALSGDAFRIQGYLEYGACDDENCLPPTHVEFDYTGNAGAAEQATPAAVAASSPAAPAVAGTESARPDETAQGDWWRPVISQLQSFGDATAAGDGWLYIFFTGFVGGLIALFTPCVWPIIPMTVSFFLKRSKNRKKGIRDAWTYGASIVVIYVALGVVITALFGASALNAL